MDKIVEPAAFPCRQFEGDAAAGRLLGLYPQVQDGLWMQRIKVLGGCLAADQWRALAAVAEQLTPAAPLHLTTRQDVELHHLPADLVATAQQRLAEVRLTGLGAGGDTLRNITVCPCSGTAPDAPDLVPLACRIRRQLELEEGILTLPRKFKISLSACTEACGQPWINDLGFVAYRKGSAWRFRVMAAGSLGPRPATAMQLFDALPADDCLPCAVAMVRLFAAHGDRQHRGRARLRHVRELLGDDRFAALAHEALDAVKRGGPWARPDWPQPAKTFGARLVLTFPNGDVTPAEATALADLAEHAGVRVRIGLDHRIIVFGPDKTSLAMAVARHRPLDRAAAPQPSVVACPGNRWCKHGLVDTNKLADRLRALGTGMLPPETAVRISGCPNGCAHSGVADVGLIGVRVQEGGNPRDGYHLLTGGGMGRNERLATPAARSLSADAVVAWFGQR
jgi:sulfite reductase (NADPH) hemoprotein beta-component